MSVRESQSERVVSVVETDLFRSSCSGEKKTQCRPGLNFEYSVDQWGLRAKEQVGSVGGKSLRRNLRGILAAPANRIPAAGRVIQHHLGEGRG